MERRGWMGGEWRRGGAPFPERRGEGKRRKGAEWRGSYARPSQNSIKKTFAGPAARATRHRCVTSAPAALPPPDLFFNHT